MEAIINFWNYLKAFLMVKIGFISTAIDHRMTRSFIANIDESRFYFKGLKEDDDDHSVVNNMNTLPKPGFYLSWCDAATNGCLLGEKDDGPGLYN